MNNFSFKGIKRIPIYLNSNIRSLFNRTVVLVFLISFCSVLLVKGQSVTINEKNVTLTHIFKIIGKQTSFDFAYGADMMKKAHRVTVNLRNVSLQEALDSCFKNQPLTYEILDNNIIIRERKVAKPAIQTKAVVQHTYQGKVVDEQGVTMVGVTVRFDKSEKTVLTKADGTYDVTAVDFGKELLFSYVGYDPVRILPRVESDLLIKMFPLNSTLDTMVVTGLFSRPKENFTGAATSVSGKDLRNVNMTNIFDALKVFDPAIRIPDNVQFGSNPNVLPNISLRGTNNFPLQEAGSGIPASGADFMSAYSTNPSMPLFILDGFEVSLQKIYDLDINRIANITILKDAVGTAAYGSRASNGVIVVETRQPTPGRLTVNYATTLQITNPDLTSYQLLNAKDKLELERIAGRYNGGDNPQHHFYYDQLYSNRRRWVEQGVDTYWLSQPLQTGVGTRHSLYVEGGDDFIRYGANIGYNLNKGVMKGSSRQNLDGGMFLSYRNKQLLVRNQLDITSNRANNSPWGSFSDYTRLNQYWSPYDESGRIRKVLEREYNPMFLSFGTIFTNPMYNATLGTKDFSQYIGISNNTFLEWRPIVGLKVTGKLGLTKQSDESDVFLPADHTSFAHITDYNSTEYFNRGRYTRTNGSFFSYDASVLADYNRAIGRHLVFGTFGLSAAQQKSEGYGVTMSGFPNDKLDELFLGNTYLQNSRPTGFNNISRRASMFTSLNYTYDRRYLVDFSFNIDGSSQFGSKNRFAPFWATGVGWNLHEESFFRKSIQSINRFKVRAGVGTTGNQQFPPYMGMSTYRYSTDRDYLGMLGTSLMGYGNTSLQWQQTIKYNFGADIAFFNDRVMLRLDAYKETTNDLLLDINTPPSLGVSAYKENVGKLDNRGIEGNLNVFLLRDAKRSTFWSVFVNAIHNRNSIKEISNSLKKLNEINDAVRNPDGSINRLQTRPRLRFVEGQSVNAIWAVRSAGIDPSNGREVFIKPNGESTYTWSAADKVIVGDAIPKLRGNFGTNISYRGFQLGIYCSYQLGGKLYNQTLADRIENVDMKYNVDERVLLGRWQKPGDQTFFKGVVGLDGFPVTSPTFATSRFVQKNNFVNVESLSFGYVIPDKRLSRWGIKNTRINLQVNNPFYISTVKAERGLDYPFARNFTFNLSTSL